MQELGILKQVQDDEKMGRECEMSRSDTCYLFP
jgi:hypothetical protein